MRPRAFGVLAAALSAAHLAIAIGTFAIAFSFGMERFDAGVFIEAGPIEATASALANILLQPMLAVWKTIFVGRSGPPLLQWVGLALNSILWGLALAWLITAVRARVQTR